MLLVAGSDAVKHHGLNPVARVVASATHSIAPNNFAEAPVEAIRKVVDKAGLDLHDIDLFEINEAFAAVPLVAIKQLQIDPDKVNVNGGAVSIGHPIGASGLRMLYEMYLQLHGRAEERQIEDPKFGLTHNLGGFPAMNVCSISIIGKNT